MDYFNIGILTSDVETLRPQIQAKIEEKRSLRDKLENEDLSPAEIEEIKSRQRTLNQEIKYIRKHIYLIENPEEAQRKKEKKYIELSSKKFKGEGRVLIFWKDVYFDNGWVSTLVGSKIYSISHRQSKKSFNSIRTAFIKRLEPFIIDIKKGKVAKVENLQGFNDVINYLAFRETFQQRDYTVPINFREYCGLFPKRLSKIYFPQDRTPYLEHLCRIQSDKFRIVPLIEMMSHRGNAVEEEAFLFTIKGLEEIYVIWENINTSRATYLFRTDTENYNSQMQLIFDYATSGMSNKRSLLHSDKEIRNELGLVKIMNHTTPSEWEAGIPSPFPEPVKT